MTKGSLGEQDPLAREAASSRTALSPCALVMDSFASVSGGNALHAFLLCLSLAQALLSSRGLCHIAINQRSELSGGIQVVRNSKAKARRISLESWE